MHGQQTTLTFGAAAFGIVATVGLHASQLVAAVSLVLLTPLVDVIVLMIWMGETARMFRAGAHIADLEYAVKCWYRNTGIELPKSVFYWEHRLAEKWTAEPPIYRGTIVVFVAFALASIFVGCFIGERGQSKPLHWSIPFLAAVMIVLVLAVGILAHERTHAAMSDRPAKPLRKVLEALLRSVILALEGASAPAGDRNGGRGGRQEVQ
jgi:hypothetical protein